MVRRRNTVGYGACVLSLCLLLLVIVGCSEEKPADPEPMTVPHEGQWGIYTLDLTSGKTALLYSTSDEIAGIKLSNSGDYLAFAVKTQSAVVIDTSAEIFLLDIGSDSLTRLTDNYYFDYYPSFSPDDSSIAFLSMRSGTLDLYVMDIEGGDQRLLYNSGGHDADVDWGCQGRIAFTRDHQIWSVDSNGTGAGRLTDPPNAGIEGAADLPIGDYDPRYSPDGSKIAFERLVDVSFAHGGYDIFVMSSDGSNDTNLTNTGDQGYARGFANWSNSGDRLVYVLAALGDEGRYDIWMMNADGSQNRSVTPSYFPAQFLCRNAIFSADDTRIYFIGQWWQ